ncbi:MAG TPA: hypothetical protein VK600_04615, partial [Candidatus Saccharimonadales bacterium]|nr:hypothetical protein [Candidatus Saccharimonadales bacterium]
PAGWAARSTPARATPTLTPARSGTVEAPRKSTPEPAASPKAVAGAPAEQNGRPPLDAVRGRWAEVVERAAPAIKPLLRECRPVAMAGARLTLAFPEERAFMREKTATRAGAIEQLLVTIFGGSWAIDCIASNVELEPLTLAAAVAPDPTDPDAQALLEGVLRITGGELVDVREVR